MDEEKRRILIADDDRVARALYSRRLEAEGFQVRTAEGPAGALAAVAAERPDVLMLEIRLPSTEGVAAVRRLRADPGTADLPIVVVSAHGRETVEKAFGGARGGDAYFAKPVDFRELLGRINGFLAAPGGDRPVAEIELDGGGAEVVAFVGAKGGVGTSTVAANVAVALARSGRRTVLAETARFHGTLPALLGVAPRRRLDRLPLAKPETMMLSAVEETLLPHPSGLRVLFGPAGGAAPAAEALVALYTGLQALAETVVVDLDSAVDAFGQVTLRIASRIWVVTEPEPTSVERAEALVQLLEGWGVRPKAIGVVVNRRDPVSALDAAEIGRRTAREVACAVPAAYPLCFEAARRGASLVELAPGQPVAQALTSLAASLNPPVVAAVR